LFKSNRSLTPSLFWHRNRIKKEMTSTLTHQSKMIDITVNVKNTFLDVKREAEEPAKRSSSVPKAFKPGLHSTDWHHSDDSTNASDKDVTEPMQSTASDSEHDFPDCCSDCTEDNDGFECPPPPPPAIFQKRPLKLTLDDMVARGQPNERQKLKASAKPFQSVRAPPTEVTAVISNAAKVVSSVPGVLDVQVNDGGMGGTTMIVAEVSNSHADIHCLLSVAKDSLLKSAADSENTYVFGYGGHAFNHLDDTSFSAKVVCVPVAHRSTACWDTYEKGRCPRFGKCRWDHPAEMDMIRLIVMVKRRA